MLIILLIGVYLTIKLLDVLNTPKVNTENYLENQVTINEGINQHVQSSPTKRSSTIQLKKKILNVVNDRSIPVMEKPNILVELLVELREHEDTSEFMETFPEIHMNIFGRNVYD